MMEDTPSNYNIPNGRIDGKSMGIKAILYEAKKAGLNVKMAAEMHSALDVVSEASHLGNPMLSP